MFSICFAKANQENILEQKWHYAKKRFLWRFLVWLSFAWSYLRELKSAPLEKIKRRGEEQLTFSNVWRDRDRVQAQEHKFTFGKPETIIIYVQAYTPQEIRTIKDHFAIEISKIDAWREKCSQNVLLFMRDLFSRQRNYFYFIIQHFIRSCKIYFF